MSSSHDKTVMRLQAIGKMKVFLSRKFAIWSVIISIEPFSQYTAWYVDLHYIKKKEYLNSH